MSQPDLESVSVPSVITKKPQLNIYTVLLIIALISLVMAIIFLALELRAYDYDSGSQVASLSSPLPQHSLADWV
ncbi:MAG: hypothetical protein MI725_00665 [Pirellulales bacterium]|nr:hypothetical protein [Pirellulales bacterium]